MTPSKLTLGTKARFGLAAALVVAGTAAIVPGTIGTANAAAGFTLSPATGPAGVATAVISVAGKGFQNAAAVDQVDNVNQVQFQAATCPTTYAASNGTSIVSSAAYDVVSATRLLVTAPSLTTTGGAASGPTYNVCFYNNASTKVLLGTSKYTVYTAPSVASVAPAKGLPAGGGTITITGDDFTAKSTVTVGGTALKTPKVTVNAGATDDTITGVVPAGTMGATRVVVTTEGGASANVAGDDYTYVNAVTVSPKTNTGAAGQKIVIKGSGFKTGTFSTASPPVAGNRAVLFTLGGWAGNAAYTSTAAASAVIGQNVGACTALTIVTDTEMVCTAPALATDGSYTVVVTTDAVSTPAETDGTAPSIVSSSATYTVAAF